MKKLLLFAVPCWLALYIGPKSLGNQSLAAKARGKSTVKPTTQDPANDTGATIEFSAATGYGVFQDIQVPANPYEDKRIDGRTAGLENADHTGVPLAASLGLRFGELPDNTWATDLSYLIMQASTGPVETQSATYRRIEVASELRTTLGQGRWRPSLVAQGALRRSEFANVSTGHMVDAMILRGGVGLWSRTHQAEAFAGASPLATLAYDDGKSWTGKRFDNAEAQLTEVGVRYAYHITERVALDANLAQEQVQIKIRNLDDYRAFGLYVAPETKGSRSYIQSTSVLRLGFSKNF